MNLVSDTQAVPSASEQAALDHANTTARTLVAAKIVAHKYLLLNKAAQKPGMAIDAQIEADIATTLAAM